jgi:threonine/homoserine/homoserine lactone efflux protein
MSSAEVARILDLLEYIVYALVACIGIFIVPGQLFFIWIQESLKGIKSGIAVLLGELVSEILLLLVFSGLANLLIQHLFILRIVGATLLVWLGFSALRSALKVSSLWRHKMYSGGSFALGFLFTILNPPFIIWLLTVGITIINDGTKDFGSLAHAIFAFTLITTTTAMTLVIVLLTARGRRFIGERGLRILSAVSGIAFLILAINSVLTYAAL